MLRRQTAAAVELIARYWNSLDSRPVRSAVKPGEIYYAMPPVPPSKGLGEAGFSEALRTIEGLFVPGLTHWQSPNFFAFFPANISTPAVLGELLSAGLGVQGMLWATSPACTEVESRVVDWLAQMLDLPEAFLTRSANGGGVIQSTASEATLSALVAGRWRVQRALGEEDRPLAIYASTQAHSSIIKAAMIAGLARNPEDAHSRRRCFFDGHWSVAGAADGGRGERHGAVLCLRVGGDYGERGVRRFGRDRRHCRRVRAAAWDQAVGSRRRRVARERVHMPGVQAPSPRDRGRGFVRVQPA
jgi:aromatic-L-amino-acid decarboxylase